jgi:hypothetical protein
MVGGSGAVLDCGCALVLGAMGTAINLAALFYAVSENPAVAMTTRRGHPLDCTFETVECHCAAVPADTEGFVIVISANVAFCHEGLIPPD